MKKSAYGKVSSKKQVQLHARAPRQPRAINPNSIANLKMNGHDGHVTHRPRGASNKITRELKQAILDATERVGNAIQVQLGGESAGITAYLERIAIEHPR
jgi:hypothetical protein